MAQTCTNSAGKNINTGQILKAPLGILEDLLVYTEINRSKSLPLEQLKSSFFYHLFIFLYSKFQLCIYYCHQYTTFHNFKFISIDLLCWEKANKKPGKQNTSTCSYVFPNLKRAIRQVINRVWQTSTDVTGVF